MSRLRAARSASAQSSVAHQGDAHGAEDDRRRWPLRLGVVAVAAIGIGAPLAAAAAHDTEVSGQSSKKSDVGVPSTVLARSAQQGASVLAQAVKPPVPKAPPAIPVTLAPKPVVKVAPPTTQRKPTGPSASQVRRVKWEVAYQRARARAAAAPKKQYSAPSTTSVRRTTRVRSAPVQSAAPSVAGNSVWDKIAACESGGDWNISTGNGFYGGLQFTQSSWQAVGGTGSPQGASRETQIEMGKRLQAQQGWGAWPVCSRKAGLR